ncbi:MAG: hypothetical protein IJN44_11615 [Clostridia bacterium]|nr:hypothetical protein [Clostridia bacterium]
MTHETLAALITRNEYGKEISAYLEDEAKKNGLVVVFGYSDDCIELRGAIDDEIGAYGGGAVLITKSGALLPKPYCDEETCPHFLAAKEASKSIKAIWHDDGGPCWTYETDIPHSTFDVFENGELYCVGIVFTVNHLSL